MMRHIKSTLGDYFFKARHALNTARKNDRVYPLIAEYNMTYQKIDSGLALLEKLMAADKHKTELHGKQLEARVALQHLLAEVRPVYMSHVKLMETKYRKNPERLERLMLMVPRERSMNGWLRQADTFYSNLIHDAEMMDRLEENTITLDKLTASHAKIKKVEQAYNNHGEAKGVSQDALEARNVLLEEFDLWFNEFLRICKIALRKHPQLLEVLGITVLSKGYVREKPEVLL
ncbi:MAG: hypothetical protein NT166_26355 [Candidatus Aminicenantes bacterium]|nr:hypothetical protein [Candidatus Aminicenantes bacterium]